MRSKFLFISAFFLLAGVAWLQVLPPRERPLSELIPAGALLSIESKDFGAQLSEWNRSRAKANWLASANFNAFQQSNLLQKMSGVYAEYANAAGFTPGLLQLLEVAGTESALALYNPRELQFLYITKLSNARLTQSQLWALKDKFEQRQAAGKTFYLRTQGERTVAFAFSGDYLFAATRDDLIARALALQSGAIELRLADEPWYVGAVKASSGRGDLRMVLNLASLVKNTYFRSYWIQRNVSELRPFTAEICDLDRKGTEFSERRVLVRAPDSKAVLAPEAARAALAQLVAAAPQNAGLYRAWAQPGPQQIAALIQEKLLFQGAQALRNSRYAPAAPTAENAGSDADLETRIDQAPLPEASASGTAVDLLQALLTSANVEAAIEIQSSELPAGSGFVSLPSAIGIAAASDWDTARVRDLLTQQLSDRLSNGAIGVRWVPASSQTTFRMDGLATLLVAARGRVLYLSNNEALLGSLLTSHVSAAATTDNYAASFRVERERSSYYSLMRALDAVSSGNRVFPQRDNQPAFFSANVESLGTVLANIHSIDVREQELPDRTLQFVRYF